MFCSACGSALPTDPPLTCGSCGTTSYVDSKPCASTLTLRAGRVLLVRRRHAPWREAWDLPGGHCDGAEHPESTAVRETLEEAGVTVRLRGLHGIWVDSTASAGVPDGAAAMAPSLCIYYLAEVPPEQDPVPGDEMTECAWFAPHEIPWDSLAFSDHLSEVLMAWAETAGSNNEAEAGRTRQGS